MNWARVAGVWTALAILCLTLVSCAEFSERGGIVAYGGDKLLFPAAGKGHRVLRAYVVTGALTAIARTKGIPGPEQASFYGSLTGSLDLTKEAFICAYQSRDGCIFFDEKMARLDYAIFKLAVQVLIDDQQKKLGTQVRDALIGEIPILTPLSKAATNTVATAGVVGTVAKQSSDLLTAILSLDYSFLINVGRITPLYRDAIEMDMRILVDYLERRCKANTGHDRKVPRHEFADIVRKNRLNVEHCIAFLEAERIYSDGNGELGEWRDYIKSDAAGFLLPYVTPSADHFIAVSNVIAGACSDINEKYARECVTKILFASEAQTGKAYARAVTAATNLAKGETWADCPRATSKFPECQLMAGPGTGVVGATESQVRGTQ